LRTERPATVLSVCLGIAFATGCGTRGGEVLSSGTPGAYFLSPVGSDGNPGTESAPWKTFRHALPLLRPGLTLILLDGTYTGADSGYLRALCGTEAMNGTPDSPITVRAQHERRAFLKGDGSAAPVEISACANWVVEGLYAEGADVAGQMGDEPGSVFILTHACNNVTLRRVLGAHPNRFLTASVFVIAHGVDILVEEAEALDFHYFGFHAYDSTRPVFRRDYAHSRNGTDAMGGMPTALPTTGDGGFLLTKSVDALIENCIAERVGDGFTVAGSRIVMGGRTQPAHNRLLGDVANDVTQAGFVIDSRCNGTKPCNQGDQIVSDALLTNDVANGCLRGFVTEGGVRTQIENATIVDATDAGISFAIDPENVGLTSSAFARSSLVAAPAAGFGFRSVGQFDWSFSRCNSFGPPQGFSPRDGHVVDAGEIDPLLGGCIVYLPAGSPLKMPAGSDIGADIVFRYEGGQLTTVRLWDAVSGQFPCGATVAGLNDSSRADASCIGVHTRLHIGTDGCPLP
jgi:hypothetical protein